MKQIEAVILSAEGKELSVEERNLVERYWKFSCRPSGFPIFEVSASYLRTIRPAGMSNTGFDRLIREDSILTLSLSAFNCRQCKKPFPIAARRDLIRKLMLREETWTCEGCLNKSADIRLYEIMHSVDNRETANQSPGTHSYFSIHDLNFAEKVSLFGLLTELHVNNDGNVRVDWNDLDLLGSRSADDGMLAALIEKGAILNYAPVSAIASWQLDGVDHVAKEHFVNASQEAKDDFYRFMKKQRADQLQSGLCFALDGQSDSFNALSRAIFENLTTEKLSLDEFVLVKEQIERCLLEKAMHLAIEVHNEYGLRLSESIRLESVLLRTMTDFTPRHAYRLMIHQGRNLASTLHKFESTGKGYRGARYERNIYARLLDQYIEMAKEYHWNIYPHKMPATLGASYFEEFLAIYILGEKSSWDYLTGEQVISLAHKALTE